MKKQDPRFFKSKVKDINIIYNEIKKKQINNNLLVKQKLGFREKTVVGISFIMSFAILTRLFYLNYYNSDFLIKTQNNNIVRNIPIIEARGSIFDRNNIGLAISTPMNSIYFNYSEFNKYKESNIEEVNKLNQVMLFNNIDLLKLDKNQYLFRNISPTTAKIFESYNVEGVYVYENYKRFYPLTETISNLIGRTNIDDNGIDGIEYNYNNKLTSINGSKKIIKNLKGQVIDSQITLNPIKGNDLHLTIDSNYQSNVYKFLKNQVLTSNAKGGAVIVLNAKTGEILSMASYPPSYNPNLKLPKNYKKTLDPTYQSVFDPGSIMKPLIVAKAINDKKVNENTTFDTKPYKVGNKIIVDDHPMSSMTVSQIIQFSSDIGTSKISLMYQPKEIYNYYQSLGFGKKSGIGLGGETKGILNPYQKWTKVDQALMSYGYGISINLLQIAASYTIFTNNGCYLKPTLILNQKSTCSPIISNNTSIKMRKILEDTVIDGTGKNAGSSDFSSAGKTGTAQKLINGKYVNNAHIASFVGFAPVENPKYIVAVMIDEPKNGYYAATTAAPLFQKIMSFLMSN